jgi:ribosomal protein L24E
VGTIAVGSGDAEWLVCLFCGARLGRERGVAVRLRDGSAFACCATPCAPLARAVEERRWEAAAAALQLALPLAAS